MANLEARGKSHLPSYLKLKQRFRQLTSKRAALVVQVGGPQGEDGPQGEFTPM